MILLSSCSELPIQKTETIKIENHKPITVDVAKVEKVEKVEINETVSNFFNTNSLEVNIQNLTNDNSIFSAQKLKSGNVIELQLSNLSTDNFKAFENFLERMLHSKGNFYQSEIIQDVNGAIFQAQLNSTNEGFFLTIKKV